MPEFKIIDGIDVYLTSRSYGTDDDKPMTVENVRNYHAPDTTDLELPTEAVDHYRVFPDPQVSELLTSDIADHGVLSPLRIYTNGTRGVLRDGHHRLVAARGLGIPQLPVHIVPNWLVRVYDEYELPYLEPLVKGWLDTNLDFSHQGHTMKRAELNHMSTRVYCSCGANWRETHREPWESVTTGVKI